MIATEDTLNTELIKIYGIAIDVAQDAIKAIKYQDGKFGIGFFNGEDLNEVVVRIDGDLEAAGKVRDKLHLVIADAIVRGIERANSRDKTTWKGLVDEFHKFFYYPIGEYRGKNEVRWFGRMTMKPPMDMMLYQEIIYENNPDVIVETGTAFGGSAYYFATLFDLLGNGRVISIDKFVIEEELPEHERIDYWVQDSTSETLVAAIKDQVGHNQSVMVVLDSDHSKEHVLKELDLYSPLVTKGQYLVVEDTNINGHPVMKDFGEGPYEALQEWLPKHPEFVVDTKREHFIFSQNSGGWLKRL